VASEFLKAGEPNTREDLSSYHGIPGISFAPEGLIRCDSLGVCV